jgi:hypothetical protein
MQRSQSLERSVVSMQARPDCHEGTTHELGSPNAMAASFRALAGVRGFGEPPHARILDMLISNDSTSREGGGLPHREDDGTSMPGMLSVHGVSKPCSIHYRVEQVGSGEFRVRGTTRIDLRDFGIDVPSYLGVHVDPGVGIQVDFSLHDL